MEDILTYAESAEEKPGEAEEPKDPFAIYPDREDDEMALLEAMWKPSGLPHFR